MTGFWIIREWIVEVGREIAVKVVISINVYIYRSYPVWLKAEW
jgi:hypothetical protein